MTFANTKHAELRDERDASCDEYFISLDCDTNPATSEHVRATEYWTDGRIQRSGRYQYHVYREARRVARRTQARTVVDVGCGVGTKLCGFFGQGYRVVGIDTPKSIEICRRLYPDGNWIDDDFENPRAGKTRIAPRADLIICADVIEHLERPDRLFAYLRSLASRDSSLVLSTPDRQRNSGVNAVRPTNAEHVREWSVDEFRAFVQHSGWRIIDHKLLLPFRPKLDFMTARYVRERIRSKMPLKTCQLVVCRPSQSLAG